MMSHSTQPTRIRFLPVDPFLALAARQCPMMILAFANLSKNTNAKSSSLSHRPSQPLPRVHQLIVLFRHSYTHFLHRIHRVTYGPRQRSHPGLPTTTSMGKVMTSSVVHFILVLLHPLFILITRLTTHPITHTTQGSVITNTSRIQEFSHDVMSSCHLSLLPGIP
jgi:hypothetical protein